MGLRRTQKRRISVMFLFIILVSTICFGCKQADAFSFGTPKTCCHTRSEDKIQKVLQPLVKMECTIRNTGLENIQRTYESKRQNHTDFGRGLTVGYLPYLYGNLVHTNLMETFYLDNVMENDTSHYIITYIHHSDGKKGSLSIF